MGYFVTLWMARYSLYAGMLPAACLGWGAGLCARVRSVPLSIACAVAGLALGIYVEWRFFPFYADHSLGYFLRNLQSVNPVHLLLIAFGAFLSYRLSGGSVAR